MGAAPAYCGAFVCPSMVLLECGGGECVESASGMTPHVFVVSALLSLDLPPLPRVSSSSLPCACAACCVVLSRVRVVWCVRCVGACASLRSLRSLAPGCIRRGTVSCDRITVRRSGERACPSPSFRRLRRVCPLCVLRCAVRGKERDTGEGGGRGRGSQRHMRAEGSEHTQDDSGEDRKRQKGTSTRDDNALGVQRLQQFRPLFPPRGHDGAVSV